MESGSPAREWIIRWAAELHSSRSVHLASFEEGLGRIMSVAGTLERHPRKSVRRIPPYYFSFIQMHLCENISKCRLSISLPRTLFRVASGNFLPATSRSLFLCEEIRALREPPRIQLAEPPRLEVRRLEIHPASWKLRPASALSGPQGQVFQNAILLSAILPNAVCQTLLESLEVGWSQEQIVRHVGNVQR